MTIYFINWVADYELKMIQYLKKKYKIKNITTPKKNITGLIKKYQK